MNSKTKNRINFSEIKQLVGLHFPDEIVLDIKELDEGMMNAAYFIKGSGKLAEGIVLKIGPLPDTKLLTYEKNLIKAEVKVYELLNGATLPIPKVLASDFSKKTINSDYFFMTSIEGTIWRKSNKGLIKKSRPKLIHALGSYNAKIHSIKGEWFGYIKDDKAFQFDAWYEAFFSMVQNILKDGEKNNCKLPYKKIEEAVIRNRKFLDDVKAPHLVNFDLWAGNILLMQSGNEYKISGIIDFERSFYGDPFADFTASMFLYSDIEKEMDFQKGYNEVLGYKLHFDKSARIRMMLYKLYMAIILYVETYRFNKIYARLVKVYTKLKIKSLIKKLNK